LNDQGVTPQAAQLEKTGKEDKISALRNRSVAQHLVNLFWIRLAVVVDPAEAGVAGVTKSVEVLADCTSHVDLEMMKED
jgi:hypothetical protein